jgi:hypothetical protein
MKNNVLLFFISLVLYVLSFTLFIIEYIKYSLYKTEINDYSILLCTFSLIFLIVNMLHASFKKQS